jgi:hypothetical protein
MFFTSPVRVASKQQLVVVLTWWLHSISRFPQAGTSEKSMKSLLAREIDDDDGQKVIGLPWESFF